MKNRQLELSQRDWDESIMERLTPKWDGVGCYYCGSSDRKIEEDDGTLTPCPECNKSGDRAEREHQAWLEE